ncbi:MAG: exodeoxyribonuclease VII small subunit [Deferribacterales bacterium]|nr:exodeoxyribonuclease VII small subunit [Deferribacterales bacterium]
MCRPSGAAGFEEIVSKLESEDSTLEETVKLFKEGMNLSKDCRNTLVKVENSVKEVIGTDDAGNPQLTDFDKDDEY